MRRLLQWAQTVVPGNAQLRPTSNLMKDVLDGSPSFFRSCSIERYLKPGETIEDAKTRTIQFVLDWKWGTPFSPFVFDAVQHWRFTRRLDWVLLVRSVNVVQPKKKWSAIDVEKYTPVGDEIDPPYTWLPMVYSFERRQRIRYRTKRTWITLVFLMSRTCEDQPEKEKEKEKEKEREEKGEEEGGKMKRQRQTAHSFW
jgi:hypothetical protein